MASAHERDKSSFGRGRRVGIAIQVALTVVLGLAVFALVNWLATRPKFRTSFDATRTARFTISDETKALIESVRADKKKLQITTYFQDPEEFARHPRPEFRPLAPIQARCRDLTRDLLRRLSYLGGDALEVRHEDIYGASFGGRARAESLDGSIVNSVRLQIGERKRSVGLLQDLADIEFPQATTNRPGSLTQPVLRAYRGESVLARAMQGLLQEKGLVAYWLGGQLEADLQAVDGGGASGFARALRARGFQNKRLDLSRASQVPADCRLLIILGPETSLKRHESDVIDSYLRRGGRALFTAHLPTTILSDSAPLSFRYFLGKYGVRLSPLWLWNGVPDPADDASYVFGRAECARIIVQGGLSAKHPVSARLRELGVPVVLHRARALTIGDSTSESMRAQYFLSTNPRSFEVEPPRGDRAPSMAYPSKEATATRHVGVALEFPVENAPPGRLLIVSGMVLHNGGDPFLARHGGTESLFARNERFGVLAADWLVRQDGQISLAASSYRPATMDVAAPQLERAQFWLVRFVPLFFLALALFVLFWRRRA